MNQEIYKSTFPALTGFRFLSALLVFIFHYNFFEHGTFLWGLCNEMYIGVGMFFVLSGFLITYNYYDQVKLNRDFLKIYFVKRFARIYPIYFLLTFLYFIYHFIKQPIDNFSTQFLLNIFLLKGFSDKYLLSGIAQAWSLTTEECFYLCAPFIYWLVRFRRIFWIQPVFILLTGVILVLVFQNFSGIFFENFHFLFIATFFGRCFEFYAGIQLALWIKKKPGQKKIIGRNCTVAGIVLILVSLFLMSGIRYLCHIDHATSHPIGLFVNNVLVAFSVIVLLIGLIEEKTLFSKILSSPPVVLLGKSSYAFYLIHAGLLADFLTRYTFNNLFLKFVSLQIAALFIFLLVEKPLNRAIRGRLLSSYRKKRE